jgi:hypothetical protein
MVTDDSLIYSHRRALTLWLIASGALWAAAAWALLTAG